MASLLDLVSEAEQKLVEGDVEGFLGLFGEEAQFCIPGATQLSGDYDRDSFRNALSQISQAIQAGTYKPEMVCRYGSDTGVMSVFDNHVVLDGQATKYHSVHEWIARDGRPSVLLVYVHEYDLFERAWSQVP